MEEYLSFDLQKIKQALLNFNQDNFKENSINFFEALGYKSSKDISFINSPDVLYNQLYQEGKVFDKNKVLFYRWKKCYGLFHYTTEELNNILQYHQLMLSEDYNQSYLFLAIELNGFFYKEQELMTISEEINKCSETPIIILFKYFDKLALSITKRRINKVNNEKFVIEPSVIRVKQYRHATDIDAKLFADLSIYNVLQTTKLAIQEKPVAHIQKVEEIQNKDNTDFSIDVSKAVNRLMDESKYDDYDFEDEEERYSAYEHRILNDTIKWYLSKIGKYKLLTREREFELARHIINDGKITNEQEIELILSNLKLVISVAKRYIPRLISMDFEDIIQEGNIGLIKAVEHFDHSKGYKFSTYATWWIKQSISRALCNKNRLIRLPVHVNETLYKMNRFKTQYFKDKNDEPTISDIAENLNLKEQNVIKITELSANILSIDTQIGNTDLSISDTLNAGIKYQPDYAGTNDMFYKYLVKLLLNKLKFKEFKVICHRKGLLKRKAKTLEEVGVIYKVTRERIRQIEDRSFEKIKKLRALKDYRNYFLPQKPLDVRDESILFKKNDISYLPERTEIARKIYALYGINIDTFREKYIETALLNGYSNKQLELINIDELYQNLKNPPKPKVNFEKVKPNNNSKLSIKDIVSVMVDLEPAMVNNDREFCKIFDEIALSEGYTKETLPSYWTILRAVYDYKKNKGIEQDKQSSRTPINYDLDLSNPILDSFSFDKTPTTKEIIREILKYKVDLAGNDREFCKLFDLIAIKSGYNPESLPKYWNIIRAIYDCKKELKEIMPTAI